MTPASLLFVMGLMGLMGFMAAGVHGAEVIEAIVTIRAQETGTNWGYVILSQVDTSQDGRGDVTVDVRNLQNVPDGEHGFHIHQYGDQDRVGGHFVPLCNFARRMDDITEKTSCDQNPDQCICDSTHGLPPSNTRQPGDMGNLKCSGGSCTLCDAGDNCQSVMAIGQKKMSLTNPLRSVLGRAVAIHKCKDDGSTPSTPSVPDSRGQGGQSDVCANTLGNAGPVIGMGVVTIKTPNSGDTNAAQPPSEPSVDTLICRFSEGDVEGTAMVSVDLTKVAFQEKGACRMYGEFSRLTSGVKSFHFHEFGDTSNGVSSNLGPIYNSAELKVEKLQSKVFASDCGLTNVNTYVGRTLTIHGGPSKDDPTVAIAECGMANPESCFDSIKDGSALSCNLDQQAAASAGTHFAPQRTISALVAMLAIAMFYLAPQRVL